jgi:long-chain acyl-CoA synthetase
MKITDIVFQSLGTWGDHPAYIELLPDNSAVYTSAEKLMEQINDMGKFLKKSGIQNNYLVAFFLRNSVGFVSVFLSLMDIGAKPVPVNLAYRKIELDEIFSNADPHAVIAEQEFLPLIAPYLKNKIVILRSNGKFKLHQASKKQSDPADIEECIASINYTYRGYGYPLGAMVPHAQYLMGTNILEVGVQLKKRESLLIILPMQHIFTLIGCVFLPLLYHITSVISYRRNPLRLFEYIQKYKINNVLAVPELYDLFLKLDNNTNDLSTMKAFLSGGSVLPKENFAKLINTFNVDLIHGYGLTEFTPVSRNIRGQVIPGTIGLVCDGLEYKISSPNKNNEGELLIKTPNMTKSYYKKRMETEEAFEDEWFKTGDICRFEDDHLIFVKQKKNTGKIKGNMVDLEEVKRAMLMFPKIKEVSIICENNVLTAMIKISSNTNFNKEALKIKQKLEDQIAVYKIPQVIKKLTNRELYS